MLKGRLNDLVESQILSKKIQSSLLVLKEHDFSAYPAGRHELGENLFFFLNEYETKEAEACFWEAHQVYLDFHYILEGRENIAVDHIDHQQVKEAYNEEKDATFFEGDVQSIITMNPGDVMICLPEDSHMAGITPDEKENVRKVVLKVKL
ncbi:YhcH/YjgK/YiaL family protein [Neobacillus niacini]|uniref:YhcH/YjgK/YiaL family protein n=1 Tax=Neobacillus niacini TaxID=86668 RepID=UPI001C8F1799|nr:YhcH/YjgK/YiaL family protein [Neobacillus niacini]MBY0149286.1 YhcH/YjgK/YiaL family protein [Neobacillus niacini]